jgi:hypothetical protein
MNESLVSEDEDESEGEAVSPTNSKLALDAANPKQVFNAESAKLSRQKH